MKSSGYIDLTGYALHQTLRHLPMDMYVTDIRVRTPGVGDWVRVEKCQFSNRDNKMTTRILFNDMTVSGTVQLLDDSEILKNSLHPIPREFCKMSLRFQRAGLGINAFPTRGRSRGLDVRTEARFLDPKFLSVHAYGCKLNDIFKRENQNDNLENLKRTLDKDNSKNARILEPRLQDKILFTQNTSTLFYPKNDESFQNDAPLGPRIENLARNIPEEEEEQSEVRIITLNPELRTTDDSSKWLNLHREQESDLNDFHRQRLLDTRSHTLTEREKLKAVLHVQNLIAQQANHVFQTQGPFSQVQKPVRFKPFKQSHPKRKPTAKPYGKPHSVISTITELDENLTPIRPVPQQPFEALLSQSSHSMYPENNADLQNYYEVVSREMEDIFLKGVKTLLTRYVEKQLEIPLKEALMVNIGYTVSYG